MATTTTAPRPGEVVSQSALGMAAGRAASMVLGFVFWLAAARFFPTHTVGAMAGLVSSMMLCTQFAQFGIGNALIVELPKARGQERHFIWVALWWTVLAALVVSMVFLLLGATVLDELGRQVSSPEAVLAFVIMCILGTANIIIDQTSMALGRGAQVLGRNLCFGVVAALCLVGLRALDSDPRPVFLLWAWVVAGVTACAIGVWQFHSALPRAAQTSAGTKAISARLWGTGLSNQALTLAERAPALILPILVIERLGAAANAAWYPAWMMAWGVCVIPMSAGLALFSAVADEDRVRPSAVRSALRTSLLIGGAAAVVVMLGAPFVLSALGKDYAAQGVGVARILAAGVIPFTFTQMYFAVCRGTGRLWQASTVAVLSGLAGVVAVAVLADGHGLSGIAWGWFGAQCATGLWAALRLRDMVDHR